MHADHRSQAVGTAGTVAARQPRRLRTPRLILTLACNVWASHRHPSLPPRRPRQVLRLWEALWAGVPGLHLYLCVAALEHHRREILRWVVLGRDGLWTGSPAVGKSAASGRQARHEQQRWLLSLC